MNQLNEESINCCLETIAPRDDWLVQIGHRVMNLNYLKTEDTLNGRLLEHFFNTRGQPVIPDPHETERSLYEIIEEDPIRSYNYIQRESVKTVILIPRMALFLSAPTIEKICNQIFSKEDTDDEFVQLWYEYFFCVYFKKRAYTWYSLDLLIKASKAYPAHFKTTINMMLMDLHLPNNILLDYIETLNQEECTNLMKFVTEIQLNSKQFNHNLQVIYLIFKKCEKSDSIVQYIRVSLESNYIFCAYNKNYGKLLLCFIENLSGFNVSIRIVKRLIESHCTCYKSACMSALEKFVMDLIAVQLNVQDGPRIVIPREVEHFRL